ncbi:alanine racemase [Corynebacterium choanae]|nr:alanine racemase [Corynebacterium choanae]
MAATIPLQARLAPWMQTLLDAPERLREAVATYGSPINIVNPAALPACAAELVAAGRRHDVAVEIFFARKANKALSFVDAARDAGHGIDVASLRELAQVLARGVDPAKIIVSAAIKPAALLRLAVEHGVTVSIDNPTEMSRLAAIATQLGRQTPIAFRIATDPAYHRPTRFGERPATWCQLLADGLPSGLTLVGVHLHLHGYSAADRAQALGDALQVVDAATAAGHQLTFVDLGGGIPMSYLSSATQWETFQQARAELAAHPIADPTKQWTWNNDPLSNHYPFYQQPIRGEWLTTLLTATITCGGKPSTVAAALRTRGLALHLEPGRSVLDGGGMTVAEVIHIKHRTDGVGLVVCGMNRTQCRTTSDDILLDPILVPQPDAPTGGTDAPFTGFLVGAYCIEDEVLVRRAMHFPHGVHPGDLIAIPNTAGYFMHILESASHQIPLAHTLTLTGNDELVLDDIDRQPAFDPPTLTGDLPGTAQPHH